MIYSKAAGKNTGRIDGHLQLGYLYAYCGNWQESARELENVYEYAEKMKVDGYKSLVRFYQSLRDLLFARWQLIYERSNTKALASAIKNASIAVALVQKGNIDIKGAVIPRDLIRSGWLLGATLCVSGKLDESEGYLVEALENCRTINMMDHEADILLELARLRMAQNNLLSAQELGTEALKITRRCGYILKSADVHLLLAEVAVILGEIELARLNAKESFRLARCDGPPEYTYRVTYEAADALLIKLEPKLHP